MTAPTIPALRQELAKALFDQMVATSSLAQDLGYEWESTPKDAQEPWFDMADALLPIVARALTETWDGACMALGWALENGDPSGAAAYVASTNPFASGDTTNGEKDA